MEDSRGEPLRFWPCQPLSASVSQPLTWLQTVRLDRAITLKVVQPLRRPLRLFRSLTPRRFEGKWALPILMYHGIGDDPEPGVAAYYRVNTSPVVFRQQMQFLADHGYRTINLDQLVTMLGGPATQPSQRSAADSRLVVITFDDGLRNFYTEAFPVLQEHHFTATMFLPTAFIGDTRRTFAPRCGRVRAPGRAAAECLTWSEVRGLRQAGIEFGSHTVNHPKLVELDWPGIKSEISKSKSEIEQQIDQPIRAFCYPYAFPQADRSFARAFGELLGEAGYACCATTELGRARPGDDPYRLKRLPANSVDDLALFAAKLDGGYDWLARPQAIVKKLKARPVARTMSVSVQS